MTGSDERSQLGAALETLRIAPERAADLLAYRDELWRWNKAFNLTAVRDPREMVQRHLLDSLSILPALDPLMPASGRLIDVGSGAGLPGLPLAIARPAWSVTLLDSNGKKARFLRQVRRMLGLTNVEVVEVRAERYRPARPYDLLVSRAFASLGDFIGITAQLAAPGATWAAMKGKVRADEFIVLPAGYAIERSMPLSIPGLLAERHLILIRRGEGDGVTSSSQTPTELP